ncbi:MAG: hypothetical protein EOP11_08945 [Proteobacteria bacterium]|nr:MAG: hypothetical protein EOP11_08945 [Pseudomonadota bacterium]
MGCFALSFSFLTSCGSPAKKSVTIGADALAGSCVGGPTTGAISRWDENPRTSSGNASLAFTSTLSASDAKPGVLTGLAGNCLLQNQMFSLTKDSYYPSSIAAPSGGALLYAPSTPQFRQLNSFYAASELRDLMGTIGENLSSLSRISIDAHCKVANNAYFSPSQNALCLGYADVGSYRRIWAADDADVIVHEAGHAVNHALSSTSVLNSSGEAGAIDESIADYWALTVHNNSVLSEWFLGYLGGIRDASLNYPYPGSMQYEVHDDGEVLTQTLWRLRASLGRAHSDAIVAKTLVMLPTPARFSDFYLTFYAAAKLHYGVTASSDPNLTLIRQEFTARGIHRTDAPTAIAPDGTRPTYVIDDHSISALSGGNCNGVLDVGETALVLVNLRNPIAGHQGMGVAYLSSIPAGITVPSGGGVGEFFRFLPSQSFANSLPTGSTRGDATSSAAFLVRATTAGMKTFSANYVPMFADPLSTAPAYGTYQFNFTLNVASGTNQSSCSNSALWP